VRCEQTAAAIVQQERPAKSCRIRPGVLIRLLHRTRVTICPVLGPFSCEDIRDFLAEYGYTSNPKGLEQSFPVDFIAESKGEAYLDVNAEAVRKGDEVPDRPVRISFHKIFDGAVIGWRLKSVEELASGVNSKALDRSKDTPKTSPWPETMPRDDSTVA
jgi:hypothetical protein